MRFFARISNPIWTKVENILSYAEGFSLSLRKLKKNRKKKAAILQGSHGEAGRGPREGEAEPLQRSPRRLEGLEALGMPWQSSLTIKKMIEALLVEAMLGSVMRKNEKRHTFYLLAGES